ncbi:hypothetical protein ACRALDRAFT_213010 [Sodiomyces alcalophilus JCM 7366]|uniref:uncharacterized protein n=1 Tax=Sodiomyces alcalophilus JCM 7366 TaxID=591952 RepID=UPI0039B68BB2
MVLDTPARGNGGNSTHSGHTSTAIIDVSTLYVSSLLASRTSEYEVIDYQSPFLLQCSFARLCLRGRVPIWVVSDINIWKCFQAGRQLTQRICVGAEILLGPALNVNVMRSVTEIPNNRNCQTYALFCWHARGEKKNFYFMTAGRREREQVLSEGKWEGSIGRNDTRNGKELHSLSVFCYCYKTPGCWQLWTRRLMRVAVRILKEKERS